MVSWAQEPPGCRLEFTYSDSDQAQPTLQSGVVFTLGARQAWRTGASMTFLVLRSALSDTEHAATGMATACETLPCQWPRMAILSFEHLFLDGVRRGAMLFQQKVMYHLPRNFWMQQARRQVQERPNSQKGPGNLGVITRRQLNLIQIPV
jgi:hypothetical protein